MTGADEHLAYARAALEQGRYLLAGRFLNGAGRDAYMAAFHAALAIIVDRTGKEPKTHAGTRSEFARLAKDEPALGREAVAFLARAYEFKEFADYAEGRRPAGDQAREALDASANLIGIVATLVTQPLPPDPST